MKTNSIPNSVCPICMMQVKVKPKTKQAKWAGKTKYFCSDICREKFLKNKIEEQNPKSSFQKWLDRLAKSNEEVFGKKGPCCH